MILQQILYDGYRSAFLSFDAALHELSFDLIDIMVITNPELCFTLDCIVSRFADREIMNANGIIGIESVNFAAPISILPYSGSAPRESELWGVTACGAVRSYQLRAEGECRACSPTPPHAYTSNSRLLNQADDYRRRLAQALHASESTKGPA